MDYPDIKLPEPVGQQITVTLVNGLGATGTLEEVEYDDAGRLKRLAIRDQADREDLVHIRGDLLGIWRLGAPVPPPEPQRPAGTILIPAGLPPDPNHGRGGLQ